MQRRRFLLFLAVLAGVLPLAADAKDPPADPYQWLEELQSERALAWIERQNERTHAVLADHPAFAEIQAHTLSVLEADDRLVVGRWRGDWIYDLWRDASHRRGIYRRARAAGFLAGEPVWEVLLDLDALAREEGRSWVWKGMALRHPDYERGLLRLSDGGADAVVVREFDIPSKRFVEDGFVLPEAKGRVGWIDEDHVFVATDFGPGTTTEAGYPRIVKRWKRGTPLTEARVVFEGDVRSVGVGARREHYGAKHLDWVEHGTSFYAAERYLLEGEAKRRIPIPETAEVHTYFEGHLLFELKQDQRLGERTYARGTVLSIPLDDLFASRTNYEVFFAPDERTSLTYVTRTRSAVLAVVMRDVRDELRRYTREDDGAWRGERIDFPGHGTTWLSNTDPERDVFMVTYSSFLRPPTLYRVDAATLEMSVIDEAPRRFDPEPYASRQLFATSKDGTRVPYFLVGPKDLAVTGANPTLLRGYGGFRIPQRPHYLGAMGRNWLDRGGVYALANIRGGGEYGPRWHEAARREGRPRAFEDFEAVAEDLIARKITAKDRLGIQGGSNGGLLVGACFTRRPDLFGAVVCQAPLLDMLRFRKLFAGASWVDEYGDPDDPADRAFLRAYSPYHNLAEDRAYPRVLFTTSTRDDRVHPGHARKMAARMAAMDHAMLYYENTEGGHAGAADARQRAYRSALVTTYLLTELAD